MSEVVFRVGDEAYALKFTFRAMREVERVLQQPFDKLSSLQGFGELSIDQRAAVLRAAIARGGKPTADVVLDLVDRFVRANGGLAVGSMKIFSLIQRALARDGYGAIDEATLDRMDASLSGEDVDADPLSEPAADAKAEAA